MGSAFSRTISRTPTTRRTRTGGSPSGASCSTSRLPSAAARTSTPASSRSRRTSSPSCRRWWEAAQRVPFEATAAGGARHDSPLCDSDQDVFNALLMSEVPDGVVTVGAQEASDALAHVEIRDAGRLECVHRGRRALVCTTRRGSRARCCASNRTHSSGLLPRVLLGRDVLLRLSPDDVPPWLRGDARARAYLLAAVTVNRVAPRARPADVGKAPAPADRPARPAHGAAVGGPGVRMPPPR